MLSIVALVGLLAVDAPSAMVVDAVWFDGAGDQIPLSDPPAKWNALEAGSRKIDDALLLFKEACLDKDFGADGPAEAVSKRNWNFKKIDGDIGSMANGEHLIGWQSSDVAVSSSRRVWPLAECVVSLKTKGTPDFAELVQGMSARVGFEPDKKYPSITLARSRQIAGGGFTGRWRFPKPNKSHRTVYVSMSDEGVDRRVNLAVTEEGKR